MWPHQGKVLSPFKVSPRKKRKEMESKYQLLQEGSKMPSYLSVDALSADVT